MKARKRFTQTMQDGLQLPAMANFIARLGVTLFMCTAATLGQGTTASLTGTITDSTGAAIVGAQVVALNVQTNLERTVAAGSTGNYVLPQLPPGQYSVSITKPGFAPNQQNNIVLEIGQVAEIDVTLSAGSEEQRVVVTASVPTIQTADSSIGSVVDSQTIVNTPLNGRLSVMGLITLSPGVQNAGAQDQIPIYGVTPSIGASGRNSYGGVGFTLDGAINEDVGIQRGEGEVPPLDGIAEFKVLTSAVPAEFGQPSQVVVVSKGGGNNFHGMLLEFNRIAATAAKSYLAGALPKPKYVRNEFGGNFSGPILIPHVYNGKDRSFVFFNYEGFRLSQTSTVSSQMPTALERSGDFSEFGKVDIVDPVSGIHYGTKLPTANLNTVSLALQNALFPQTTTSGTGTNTIENVPYVNSVTRISVRGDHKFSDKDSIRVTMMRALYGPSPSVGTTSKFGGNAEIGEKNTNSIVGWSHTFSPTLISDVTVSYLHLPIYRTPQNYKTDFSSIIPGLGPQLIEGAPTLTIKNITAVSEAGSKNLDQVYQLNASATKVFASHTVKIGGSYLYDNFWEVNAVSPPRGSYTFTGQYTGIGYADFLLGYPSATGLPLPGAYVQRCRLGQYGAYIQDDWKVTRNLTINAGIRYDLQWFADNPYGAQSLYVPSLKKVIVFNTAYPNNSLIPTIPAFQSLTELAPDAGMSSSLWGYLGQDTNNVSPRLGFSYQPIQNTVIRGAYGVFFNAMSDVYEQTPAFSNLPFQGSETFEQPTGKPTISMIAPFASTGAFSANPNVNAQAPTVTPYTEQYNLTVEHDFGRGIGTRISYVGQHNLKQNSDGSSSNARDLNLPVPFPGAVQPNRPVQPFASIPFYNEPIFHSNMNSLQVGLHKQYRDGLMVNAEYQWTRVLGTESFMNPRAVNDSYGNIGSITPQVLAASYSYALPFGEGQHFLASALPAVRKLVSGWQVSGITTVQTGQPFSVSYTSSLQGDVSGRANRVVGVPLYPTHKSRQQWFNPAAFTKPASYTYGTSGYNMMWGPHYQNWDVNLEKNTVLEGKASLQLRMDAFNVANHPNFSTPSASISNASTVGTITSIVGANRTLEFAAKLSF